jgi:hypothetical protein
MNRVNLQFNSDMTQGERIVEGIKFFGGISGLAALAWRIYETFGSYLQLEVSLAKDKDTLTALASLSNKGVKPKTLDFAMLLIGPESEDPAETARQVANQTGLGCAEELTQTDDLWRLRVPLKDSSSYTQRRRAIIPLPFFHEEQDSVADEVLRYRCVIKLDQFDPGPYSVRFYVFPERWKWFMDLADRRGFKWLSKWSDRMWPLRCTHDLFVSSAANPRSTDPEGEP